MRANQIFYNYLKLAYPSLAKAFKKKKDTYETYPDIKNTGHKFVYNFEKQTIVHLFFNSTFNGYEYGKKLVTEIFKVVPLQDGFKVSKIY